MSRPTLQEEEAFFEEMRQAEWDYFVEEGGEAMLDEIWDGLADSLQNMQPRLYAVLEEMVKRGQSKQRILKCIEGMIRAKRQWPVEGELTLGCCEAAIDRFLEQHPVPWPDPFEETEPSDDPPGGWPEEASITLGPDEDPFAE